MDLLERADDVLKEAGDIIKSGGCGGKGRAFQGLLDARERVRRLALLTAMTHPNDAAL